MDDVGFRDDVVDDRAAELLEPVLQVRLVAEDFDEVDVALVGRRQRVVRKAQLDLLALLDGDDPRAIQRYAVRVRVVARFFGDVFAAEDAVQAAQFESALAAVRPLPT